MLLQQKQRATGAHNKHSLKTLIKYYSVNTMRTFILVFALLAMAVHAENLRGAGEQNEQRDLQAICKIPGLTLDDYIALMKRAGRSAAIARTNWNNCLANQAPALRTDVVGAPCYDSGPVRTFLSFSGDWQCRSNKDCADQGVSDRCYYKLNGARGSSCNKKSWDWKAECGTPIVPVGNIP